MKRRIEAHKKVRPPAWRTLEVKTHAGHEIARHIGRAQAVIIDCITLLINNIFQEHEKELEAARLEKEVTAEIDELAESIDNSKAHFIIVTNDVGMGLVPDNKTGRLYRDLLGKANQMLAQHADEVYLMVAGLPVKIKPGR
jgi:adenosylcobinamide kinase/adenosylcobinamide-phosphate guanylyltransferase